MGPNQILPHKFPANIVRAATSKEIKLLLFSDKSQFPKMPRMVEVDDEVLTVLEGQGGLKPGTVNDRNKVYEQFEEYMRGEIGIEVKDALETEDGRVQFEQELGR